MGIFAKRFSSLQFQIFLVKIQEAFDVQHEAHFGSFTRHPIRGFCHGRGTSSRDAVPIVNVDLEDVASATKSTTSAQTNLMKEICALSGASSHADARTVWNART